MYPWEHLLLGYLVYSVYVRARHGEPPDARGALAAGFGSQFPDLIDKPLAWTLGLIETGYGIGHSIFVSPVALVAGYAVGRRLGRSRIGIGFGIAYLSHLLSDVIYPIAFGRGVEPRVILWPARSPPTSMLQSGLLQRTVHYFGRFSRDVSLGESWLYVAFQLGFAGTVVLLWWWDGAPVARELYDRLTRVRVRSP